MKHITTSASDSHAFQPEPDPDMGTEAEPDPDMGTEVEPDPDMGTEAEPDPDMGKEAEPDPDMGTGAKAEAGYESETEPVLKSEDIDLELNINSEQETACPESTIEQSQLTEQ